MSEGPKNTKTNDFLRELYRERDNRNTFQWEEDSVTDIQLIVLGATADYMAIIEEILNLIRIENEPTNIKPFCMVYHIHHKFIILLKDNPTIRTIYPINYLYCLGSTLTGLHILITDNELFKEDNRKLVLEHINFLIDCIVKKVVDKVRENDVKINGIINEYNTYLKLVSNSASTLDKSNQPDPTLIFIEKVNNEAAAAPAAAAAAPAAAPSAAAASAAAGAAAAPDAPKSGGSRKKTRSNKKASTKKTRKNRNY